jgi:PAT family acetyl-CoA transporter-like MFS transporter 1
MSRYDSVNGDDKIEQWSEKKSNLKGDYRNVGILLLLYGLQGVPQGIGLAMPILLQNRGVSYTDQAKFSFSFFPYSGRLFFIKGLFVNSYTLKKKFLTFH